jgi:hypothetical protein
MLRRNTAILTARRRVVYHLCTANRMVIPGSSQNEFRPPQRSYPDRDFVDFRHGTPFLIGFGTHRHLGDSVISGSTAIA